MEERNQIPREGAGLAPKALDTRIKMYILVNKELHMKTGKIAGQVGHGVAAVVRLMEKLKTKSSLPKDLLECLETYEAWTNGFECKVVLQATTEEMKSLAAKYDIRNLNSESNTTFAIPVFDAGKTQIPTGSFTTLTFIPIFEENAPPLLKSLKLL